MAQQWYIDDGGRVVGPFVARELRDRAADGRLRPADRVSVDRKRWWPAQEIKGLHFLPATQAEAPKPVPGHRDLPTVETDAPPADIPGYEVLGTLGAGGCGVVYRARQTKLDRVVALKMVQLTGRPSPTQAARFEKEAVALARLQHPNIVSVFDSGRCGDQVYFAMELLKGDDLGRRLAEQGPLDERTAWAVARQTAAALGHAAAEGIFHRDVKPANLFLVPMPTGFGLPGDLPMVKVTDFGLALTRQDLAAAADDRITAAGVLLGTPAYMAPEQFKSPDVDHRADIYALGATVLHALTATPPYAGLSVWDIMMAKTQGTIPEIGPGVSPESAALLTAMMAPDPAARVPDYTELIARIDTLPVMEGVLGSAIHAPIRPPAPPPASDTQSGTGTVTKSDGPAVPRPARKRRLVLAGVAGAVLIGGAVAAAVLATGGRPRTPGAVAYQPNYEEMLFPGKDGIVGWVNIGQPVSVERDDEQAPVLEVPRGAKRSFVPLPDFRVTIGLDLYKAEAAEVTTGIPQGDDAAPRPVLRITRAGGAVFGTRAGDRGEFVPLGPPVPLPSAADLEGKRPYLEVRLERAGGVWSGWFHGTKAGSAPDDGKPKAAELRVLAESGPVRIDSVVLEGLTPKP